MLLALLWWGILLKEQNDAIYQSKQELLEEKALNHNSDFSEEKDKILKHYKRQEKMIFGEGLVFVIALLIGIWFINRGYSREIEIIRQKRNFLLAITHELKSPLASIGLILETFQKRTLARLQQDKLVSHGLKETRRLSDLIENLLLSARLEKSYQINPVLIDINDLISRVIEDIEQTYPDMRFREDYSENQMVGSYDKIGLHSTFYNLIENAAKYSPKGSEVTVKTYKEEDFLVIDVCDQGPGIAENEKSKIFDQFYRSGHEETRNTHGTGIGLFIVKKMVDFHNGQ
ncbi:MAG: sensor histidine kinase, partial [Saprospiraceae bacterium]|nr:sensor histidine kinase [Saprospiraceae bacterium]